MAGIAIHPDMLRQAREAQRMSQDELAFLLGVTRTWVGQVERGDREPGYKFLDNLAHVFSQEHVARMIRDEHDRTTFAGKYVAPPETTDA